MIRRVAALAVFAMLVLAGTAQAVTLVNPDGTPVGGQWQRWVDEMRVPTYQGTVTLSLVDQPEGIVSCGDGSAAACAIPSSSEPEVILGPLNRDRQTLYHELGHVYDATTASDTERAALMAVWRLAGAPEGFDSSGWADWRHASAAGMFSPREWFAEAYRVCAVHTGRWVHWLHGDWNRVGYGYPKWFERAACRIIRSS